MFIKQIDMKTAFELALKGIEVKTLVPTGPGSGWTSMEPDTLQNMLADVLFFRQEPAMEVPMVEVKEIKVEGPASLTTHEVNQAIKSSLGDAGNQIPHSTGLRPCGHRSQTETGRYREASGTPESRMEHEEDRGRAGDQ